MKHLPKINILLSAYNGEAYLEEQLDSIFHQTFQNFTLYIRDDASTDGTVSLLKSYLEKHPDYAAKTILLSEDTSKNLGYIGSFWTLLANSKPADYYAFCDQDDVWLPDKLAAGIQYLNKEDSSIPLLYFSGFHYCDQNLNILHDAPRISLPVTFRDVLFYTPAFGFSIIINQTLRELALKSSDLSGLPHDGWVQKIAAAFGKILYNPDCMTLYRRHDSAITSSNARLVSAIVYWIKNDLFGSTMKDTHFVLNRFMQEYGSSLSSGDRELLALYTGSNLSVYDWFRRFSYKKRLRPSTGGDLALRICFFFCRY